MGFPIEYIYIYIYILKIATCLSQCCIKCLEMKLTSLIELNFLKLMVAVLKEEWKEIEMGCWNKIE